MLKALRDHDYSRILFSASSEQADEAVALKRQAAADRRGERFALRAEWAIGAFKLMRRRRLEGSCGQVGSVGSCLQ